MFEMARTRRTLLQSIVSPVISTSLYFVVFGAAIGSRIQQVDGVSYGAFIVPGLIMLSLLTQSIANASFGIYFPRFTGTIYELLSAPISAVRDRARLCRRGGDQVDHPRPDHPGDRGLFVPLRIEHPVWMVVFLVLTAVTFSLFGFIIGIWADGFEKLQLVPLLIVTPLTFLGGSFYSIDMLPPFWQTVTLFNPVVYLISGFRWSFFGLADVHHRHQRRRHPPGARALPRHRVVDVPDRIPAEELSSAPSMVAAQSKPATFVPHGRSTAFRRPEDAARLDALIATISSTRRRAGFDDIVALARALCDAPSR